MSPIGIFLLITSLSNAETTSNLDEKNPSSEFSEEYYSNRCSQITDSNRTECDKIKTAFALRQVASTKKEESQFRSNSSKRMLILECATGISTKNCTPQTLDKDDFTVICNWRRNVARGFKWVDNICGNRSN